MNKVARVLGLSPEEFRRRNFIRQGQDTATEQVIRENVDLDHLLARALELSDYYAKKERFARYNATGSGQKKGIGFASFMHGAGFTGSGEKYLESVAGIEATIEGKVTILVANTEIGQGTNTILSQIAADALNLDYRMIEVAEPNTAVVPNS